MRKPTLKKKLFITIIVIFAAGLITLGAWYVSTLNIAMLNPKGIIALKQYNLLAFTTLLGLLVVVPVFIMAIVIAWRYRESNTAAIYTPTVSTNRIAETIWWGIPILLIGVLSVVTWVSTYDLDPHKPLISDVKPINVQVVALDWKWLFIYPDYDIATVNQLQFPINTPVNFRITADAPMNSFWIPQLGGQIYAMAGMTTQLHLNATAPGDYKGQSANISGEGFADMKFIARASSQADFDAWTRTVKRSPTSLTATTYADLAQQSKDVPVTYYASSEKDLYDTIVMKYMMPDSKKDTNTLQTHSSHDMPDMDMSDMTGMESH